MLGSAQLMDALRGVGLNLYERKLWVALLAKGVASAGELSTIANVPRSRTYDVLQSLADKGFVILQTSKPLKYVAIPPAEALEKAKQKMREDLETKLERIERLKSSKLLDELEGISKKGLSLIAPEDLTGALRGKNSVIQHMESIFRNANSTVNIVTTPVGLNELFENHLSVLKALKQKGVKIKIASRVNESCAEAIKALNGVADIRRIPEKELAVHGRFAVIDGEHMTLGLSDPEDVEAQHMMFWTKSPHAAGNLASPLFDLVWEKAAPLNKK